MLCHFGHINGLCCEIKSQNIATKRLVTRISEDFFLFEDVSKKNALEFAPLSPNKKITYNFQGTVWARIRVATTK